MTDLTTTTTNKVAKDTDGRTFAERLRSALGKTTPRTSALLLDVSGSMAEGCGPNKTRIEKLRELVAGFSGTRMIEFSSSVRELAPGAWISAPHGGTDLARGLLACRAAGITHVVLITDGEPNNEEDAIQAARGLKVDCFYVGPDGNARAIAFLERLGRTTGGSYGKASLEFTKELAGQVREKLQITDGREAKGPIAL